MVEYGRVNAANFTNKERVVLVRTRMPMSDRVLHPDEQGSTVLTVVDPLNDGVDRPVEWRPVGAKWKSGYCKNVVVVFKARLAAGQAPAGIPHQNFGGSYAVAGDEREFVINDDTPTVTAFEFHDLFLSFGASTIFELTVPLKRSDGTVVVTKQSMTLANGEWGQTYDPSTGHLSIPGRYTEAAGPVELSRYGEAALFRVASRAYPEYQEGDRSVDHSFWQEMLYALTSGERFVDVWWWFGNSFATKDLAGDNWPPSDPRVPTCKQDIEGDVTLRIIGPKVTGTYGTASLKDIDATDLGNGLWDTTILLYSTTASVDPPFAAYPTMGDGWSMPPTRFTLYYDDYLGSYPLSTIEQNTLDALDYSEDGSAWVTAVSSEWYEKQQCYGPFGCVPGRPGEDNIPSNTWIFDDSSAWDAAGKWAFRVWNNFQLRAPYQYQELGFPPNGGSASAQATFSARHWPLARTGFPDLRGILYDSYLEANRCNKFKEENVAPVDATKYRQRSLKVQAATAEIQRPAPMTDLNFWNGRPHIRSELFPAQANLGKTGGRVNHVAMNRHGSYVGGSNGWYPQDVQHMGCNEQSYAAILSGCPALEYFIFPHHVTNAICTRPHRDGVFDADAFNNGELTRDMTAHWGYTSSAMGYGGFSNRGEPRYIGFVASVFDVVGDQDLVKKLLYRKTSLYDRPPTDDPAGDPINMWGPGAANTNTGFFPRGSGEGEYELAQHQTAEGPSGSPLTNMYCHVSWQGDMFQWHMWSVLNCLRNFYVGDMDLTDVNDPSIAAKTTAEHADELEDYIYDHCKVFVDECFQYINGTYVPYYCIDWHWDPNKPGRAIPSHLRNLVCNPSNNYSPRNPATGRPYFQSASLWHFWWTVGSIIIGWEIASRRADTEYMEKFAILMDPAQGGYTPRLATSGWFGWEKQPNNNTIEYAAVIPDPFKDRSTPNISLPPVTVTGSTTLLGAILGGTITLVSLVTGSTVITSEITSGGAIEMEDVTVYGSTTLMLAEPIFEVIHELGPDTVTGSTTFDDSAYDLIVSSSYLLGPDVVTGSTQFLRSFLTWYYDLPWDHTYRIVGSYNYTYNLRARFGDMPTKYQTLELYEGNSSLIKVTVSFEDGYENALEDAVKVMWYLADKPHGTIRIQKTLASGLSISEENVIDIVLASTDTQGLEGKYYHELYVVDENGKAITLLTGTILVTPAFATA